MLLPLNGHLLKYDKLLSFLKIADNKDKLLKILQYIIKLIMVTRGQAFKSGSSVDFKAFASTLSLSRKLGRLGNWLPGIKDFQELISLHPESFDNGDFILNFIGTGASIGNDLLDDWICLQKGRLLHKMSYLDTLDLWSTRLWFISVSIDLNFTLKKLNSVIFDNNAKISMNPEEYKDLAKKRTDIILTACKQFCDLTFCIWELANLSSSVNEHVPVVAGLSAAIIGAVRGWRKLK